MTIPFVLALVVGSIFAGACTQRFGYYVPFMLACAVIVPIAAGLFTTFQTDTGHAKWIGYQVLVGFGIGLGMQQSSMAAQTCLEKIDVPTGVSLMFFGQQLGGTVFVSVGQNILSSRLISALAAARIPGLVPRIVINAGATNLRNVVRPEYLGAVLKAYNHAVTNVFDVAVGTGCVLIVGALAMEWRSVKKDKGKLQGQGKDEESSKSSDTSTSDQKH
jgi:MFS family permease